MTAHIYAPGPGGWCLTCGGARDDQRHVRSAPDHAPPPYEHCATETLTRSEYELRYVGSAASGNDRESGGSSRDTHSAAIVHGVEVPDLETILRQADAAASVAHDFIWGRNGVTKEQASDAIWAVHNALRPLFEDDPEPGTSAWVIGMGRDDFEPLPRRTANAE